MFQVTIFSEIVMLLASCWTLLSSINVATAALTF